MEKKNGFTLTELLIVVVIIGVLASLILPRMTAQTEKANVMEAMVFLGTMRKGQQQLYNSRGTDGYVYIAAGFPTSPTAGNPTDPTDSNTRARANWAKLGMTPPDYTRPNSVWIYGAYDKDTPPAGQVRARRVSPGTPGPTVKDAGGPHPFGDITLDPDGTWGGGTEEEDYVPGRPYAPTK